jgi:hypothetical protein
MSDAAQIERVAIHEAGHAVAALALGLEVHAVHLAGRVTLRRHSPSEPADLLLFYLSGVEAERLAFGSPPPGGCKLDTYAARRAGFEMIGDLTATDALVESSQSQVRQLLSDRWLDVDRVALALLTGTGTLSGAELEALVAP